MKSVVYLVVHEDDGTQKVLVQDNPENMITSLMVVLGQGLDERRAANLVRDDILEMVASWKKGEGEQP